MLDYLISQACSARWCNLGSEDPDISGCAPKTAVANKMFWNAAVNSEQDPTSQGQKDLSEWLPFGYSGQIPPGTSRRLRFPTELCNGGGRLAYSIMMGTFRSLSESVTGSDSLLPLGELLVDVSIMLRAEVEKMRLHHRELDEGETSDFIRDSVTRCMHCCFSKHPLQQEKDKSDCGESPKLSFKRGRKIPTISFSESE